MPTARVRTLKRTTVDPAWSVTLTVPVVVKSEMNLREHWAARHRRFAKQAEAVKMVSLLSRIDLMQLAVPLRITLTRLGGKGLDSDNLAGGFKGIRDAVANLLMMDDADPRLTWVYRQEPGGLQGVRITLESGG